jgi:HEPN domain-containing protein
MVEESVAKLLLAAAERDRQAFRALAAIPGMNDAVIGFHAHQCIEKALKAVLAHAGTEFRRTHDVPELLDLLHDSGRSDPPFSEHLDELNPYAVEARYGLIEPTGLDRSMASRMVEAVIGWAQTQLHREGQ